MPNNDDSFAQEYRKMINDIMNNFYKIKKKASKENNYRAYKFKNKLVKRNNEDIP